MNHTYKIHTEEVGKSTAMRLLIHYVGDVHQPLHSTSRINDEFPKGDRGGNSFKLDDPLGELHAVWDSVLGEFSGYETLPFNTSAWATYGANSKRIREAYPVSDDVANNLNFSDWAKEANELAKNVVYSGVKENEKVPESYITANKPIAEKQLAIGGARLANLLIALDLAMQKQETKFL